MASVVAPAAVPLDLRRVYILPTRYGLMLCGLLIIILLGATNYDNALAYLLCFLLGGILLVAMLHTYRNLAGLSLSGTHVDPVFAGEVAQFVLILASETPRMRYQLHVRQRLRGVRRKGLPSSTVAESMSDVAAITVGIPATQRGYLRLSRVEIASSFPLGLLRAWAYFETEIRCTVYPKPDGELMLPNLAEGLNETNYGVAVGADEFAELSPYRFGESLHAIHWPAYARHERLLSKRFFSGSGDLRLDWRATAGLTDIEIRLRQLARWILTAEAQRRPYTLVLPNVTIPVGLGRMHMAQALTALADFK
jgi:uncharacterized protein (DUF58 family)